MNNWETEFEVKYIIKLTDDSAQGEAESETVIIEASSKSEVVNIMQHRFQYSENLKIESISKLWEY